MNEDYSNAEIGRIGADRMTLGLPIIPCKKYGDMEKVRELREQRDRLAEALQKLADCDWVITPHDRMDAVRAIANEALQSLNTNDIR